MLVGRLPGCQTGGVLTVFEPQPGEPELPKVFPNPFDALGPHPLARRAAEALQAALEPEWTASGGKMFGVLVVRDAQGRVGFLRSFSGMLAGRWELETFAPPLFDRGARAAFEPEGDAVVKALLARRAALEASPERQALLAERAGLARRQEEEAQAQRRAHRERKAARHQRRRDGSADLAALARQSRADKAERKALERRHGAQARAVSEPLARIERRLEALDRLRRIVCGALMRRIHDTYVVESARGERRPLRALYDGREPPSGAADCAGPKLLSLAYGLKLEPLALAEFWWGPPPVSGGRVQGAFYPACQDKCGPLLPFMTQGLDVAPPRVFSPPGTSAPLGIVYEDPWLVVVDKPAGLLSVPGKDAGVSDSVLARLRARYPRASGPLLVHRLDMDTSGLLVAALDARTHTALQRQFLARRVEKRYVALVEGAPPHDEGAISFPIRVDLDDRPRQIHDPVHGRSAFTEWRLLERGPRSRVALFPRTGRTHQLRVHAAHPLGLNAPIVGDRLYGHPAERLMLHAESLALVHPVTRSALRVVSRCPF